MHCCACKQCIVQLRVNHINFGIYNKFFVNEGYFQYIPIVSLILDAFMRGPNVAEGHVHFKSQVVSRWSSDVMRHR